MDLEKLAKGITEDTVESWKFYWNNLLEDQPTRIRESKRREARRAIFRWIKHILKDSTVDNRILAFKEIIEEQLQPNLGVKWTTFTTEWDLHPYNWNLIIKKGHWSKEGGGYDPDTEACSPTAFTKQEF